VLRLLRAATNKLQKNKNKTNGYVYFALRFSCAIDVQIICCCDIWTQRTVCEVSRVLRYCPLVRISVLVSAYITAMSMDPALFEQLASSIEGNGGADPDVTALSSFFKYWWVCFPYFNLSRLWAGTSGVRFKVRSRYFSSQKLSPGPGKQSRYSDSLRGGRSRVDGPGIESRWRRDLPHPCRPALGPTQPPT
jgi:hypothetical protein